MTGQRGRLEKLMPDKTGLSDMMVSLQSSLHPGHAGAHEHLRGEDKHIKLRAIAVDRPRAILVLSVGRAGQGRPRSGALPSEGGTGPSPARTRVGGAQRRSTP